MLSGTLEQMMKFFYRRIALITALYLTIIFGIFALQFTRGNTFSFTIGALSVSGSTETDVKGVEKPALPLHLGAWGLDFFLDEHHSLMAYTSGNNGVPVQVESWSRQDDGFSLAFARGIRLVFSTEKRGDIDVLSLSAEIPSSFQRVAIPFRFARSARLEKHESLTLVRSGKKLYSFPSAPLAQGDSSAVRYLPLSRSSPTVYYQTWLPAKGISITELAALPGASRQARARSVERFAASALASFRSTLLLPNLSEAVVASYVAEMGRIGMYRTAIESVPASFTSGQSRTWLTNTFFNSLERTWAGMISREREERVALSRKLTEGNPAIFEFPSLFTYLVDRGSAVLLPDVVRVASALEIASISPVQAAGILETILDARDMQSPHAVALEALSESAERRIISSFALVQDRLYMSKNGSLVDSLDTLRVATVLSRWGASDPKKEQWAGMSNLLVTSLLTHLGEDGSLPVSLALSPETGERRESIVVSEGGFIDPGRLYPHVVTGDTWYPHALSLSSVLGPGNWAWTSAKSVTVAKRSGDVLAITVGFPQGETHYMVIRGIKPFYRIQLYGMDFRTDPRFESYNSSGYRYNEDTETLFLKMRHKVEMEDIVIYLGAPTPAEPSVEEASSAPVEGVVEPATSPVQPSGL